MPSRSAHPAESVNKVMDRVLLTLGESGPVLAGTRDRQPIQPQHQISGTKKPGRNPGFLCSTYNNVLELIMHSSINTGNTPTNVATRFTGSENVSPSFSHLTSAMNAAKQIRFQYSKPAKQQLVRECLDQLRAFLAYSKGART